VSVRHRASQPFRACSGINTKSRLAEGRPQHSQHVPAQRPFTMGGQADIQELGVPQYHVVRLQKSLRELRERDGSDQQSARSAVVTFLEEHGLAQYADVLLSSGFEEMETLLDMDDLDLKDLGFPRGHALKLRRHLRDYQTNLYQEEAQNVAMAPPLATKSPERSSGAPAQKQARSALQLEASDSMKGDVERSWDTIQELGVAVVGERIYRVFFDMVPEAVECFPSHVRHKYREWTEDESEDEADVNNSAALRKLFGKVLNAVGCVVAGLKGSSKLVPLLTSLGGRHITYNTNEAFWPALGKAVNITLAELLGAGFTPEVDNAWNVVYGFMSSIMIAGLQQAKALAQERLHHDGGDCTTSQRSCVSQRSFATEHTIALEGGDAQHRNAAAVLALASDPECPEASLFASDAMQFIVSNGSRRPSSISRSSFGGRLSTVRVLIWSSTNHFDSVTLWWPKCLGIPRWDRSVSEQSTTAER